ncbi:hypothetical protein XA68_14205 [Ophiocordyceps unilateralis]|uniref:Uncharacterized protein n=1 Tax=Ophiocordyceps unilateralis TaxID=268505 RepID=A0A2A9P9H8_OPHUN|nr:hypothetical protein XA68_14205 [Ophiocordyceps unilateralis]
MPTDPVASRMTTTTTTTTMTPPPSSSLISARQHSLVRDMLTALTGTRTQNHPPQGQVGRSIMPRGASPAGYMDEPPSYSRGHHQRSFHNPIVQPTTLIAAGRFVYSDKSHAPPQTLYEISHDADTLTDAVRIVRVERLDHAVKHQDGGAPQLSTRAKHIYDLRHPNAITAPTFPFHADPASRQSLGSLGITTFRPWKRALARGYRVHRAARGPHRLLCGEVHFTAVPVKDKAVMFEWFDSQERLIARELTERGGVKSLLISAEMTMRNRDALMAAGGCDVVTALS